MMLSNTHMRIYRWRHNERNTKEFIHDDGKDGLRGEERRRERCSEPALCVCVCVVVESIADHDRSHFSGVVFVAFHHFPLLPPDQQHISLATDDVQEDYSFIMYSPQMSYCCCRYLQLCLKEIILKSLFHFQETHSTILLSFL